MPLPRNAKSRRLRRKRTARNWTRRKLVLISSTIIGIIAIVLVLSYEGNLPMNPIKAVEVTVEIQPGAGDNPKLGFKPAVMTIVIGINNTIVWKNDDSDWHTAHSNIPEFYSGIIQPGASFSHTFERPGTYPYHCDPHPWMTGVITVDSPSSTTGIFGVWKLMPLNLHIIISTRTIYRDCG